MNAAGDRCSIPKCRLPVSLFVLGKPLCERHNAERLEEAEMDYGFKVMEATR